MVVLVTGGSGSGKSEYAENLVVSLGDPRVYIATMIPWDEECRQKIARHQRLRQNKRFTTVECYRDLKKLSIPKGSTVLLECLSNLAANEYYGHDLDGALAQDAVLTGIRALMDRCANLVIVTNEIFSDGFSYDRETGEYLELLGRLNGVLGAEADRVVEVVYNIPILQRDREAGKEAYL